MLSIDPFIKRFSELFFEQRLMMPWEITTHLPDILTKVISGLNDDYRVEGTVAIHRSAVVEAGVTFKGPIIVGADCFIGASTYLRGGVFLDKKVVIGPGCEIKSSMMFSESAAAHFNFIGDSLIGSHVNFEAGAVVANHHNDRREKEIHVKSGSSIIKTGVEKFGALVGDYSKIGANAVLSPGTVLSPNAVVKRLELVNQINSPSSP